MYINVTKREPDMKIADIGNSEGKEYILFYAKKGTRLHDYAIYDKTYNEEGDESNKWPHFYRFPKGEIMAEDGYICLYTDDSDTQASIKGRAIKTFHMGLVDVLNDEGDRVYLVKLTDLGSKDV